MLATKQSRFTSVLQMILQSSFMGFCTIVVSESIRLFFLTLEVIQIIGTCGSDSFSTHERISHF